MQIVRKQDDVIPVSGKKGQAMVLPSANPQLQGSPVQTGTTTHTHTPATNAPATLPGFYGTKVRLSGEQVRLKSSRPRGKCVVWGAARFLLVCVLGGAQGRTVTPP